MSPGKDTFFNPLCYFPAEPEITVNIILCNISVPICGMT